MAYLWKTSIKEYRICMCAILFECVLYLYNNLVNYEYVEIYFMKRILTNDTLTKVAIHILFGCKQLHIRSHHILDLYQLS